MAEKCRESGCNTHVPQGRSLISFTCRILHLCKYCYGMKFPERKKHRLPAIRWFHNGNWVDLKLLMSWWKNQTIIRESERQEIKEGMQLLAEEKDE